MIVRAARALLGAAALLTSPAARAEKPQWSWEEVEGLTQQAVRVLPWHQYVLHQMMMHDKTYGSAELSGFGAGGRYTLPDGTEQDGALMRLGLGMSFGAGKPRTGGSVFAGFQADYGMLQHAPYLSSSGTDAMAAQGILYGGVAVKGVMATGGMLLAQPLVPTNSEGQVEEFEGPRTFFTIYQQEGVAFGGVKAPDVSGAPVLASLRGQLTPERLMERLDLRELGLPNVGFDRYAPDTNPYGDPEPLEEPLVEIPLGVEDIASLGLRFQVVPKVTPDLGLRRAVAGYVFQSEAVIAGGQAGVAEQGGEMLFSAQAYAVLHPEWFKYFSVWGVPRIALSYSHNVPDPVAFFPVKGANVFGVQYVYGPPEFGRPLIPLYEREQL